MRRALDGVVVGSGDGDSLGRGVDLTGSSRSTYKEHIVAGGVSTPSLPYNMMVGLATPTT